MRIRFGLTGAIYIACDTQSPSNIVNGVATDLDELAKFVTECSELILHICSDRFCRHFPNTTGNVENLYERSWYRTSRGAFSFSITGILKSSQPKLDSQ